MEISWPRCRQPEVQAARGAEPGLANTHTLLQEVATSSDNRLSPQTEGMVKLQYRRLVRQSTDPYKRAVYCVVGACDPAEEHQEVATSLDDYLWLKLCMVREDAGGSSRLLLTSSSGTETISPVTQHTWPSPCSSWSCSASPPTSRPPCSAGTPRTGAALGVKIR